MSQQKKKALGRGLSAILESPETDITSKDISGNYVAGAIASIPVGTIEQNPFQPREEFDPEALRELADSITEQGIIQPLTIRKMGYDKYQLISGERRLRAAIIAGMTHVPAYIRVANDEQMLEWALIENIQRENLNAIEIAISYSRLLEECNLTQDELSKKVGKNRATVANYIRLLKLPAEIQSALRDGTISMGHARSIITIDDSKKQLAIAHKIILEGLSVREVEKLVQKKDAPKLPNPAKREVADSLKDKVLELRSRFQSKVEIKINNKGRGNIVIPFGNNSELDALLAALAGNPEKK